MSTANTLPPLVLLLVLSLTGGLQAQTSSIPRDASLYIEEMDNDLDGYLRAELTTQNEPLRLVLRREDTLEVSDRQPPIHHSCWHAPSRTMDFSSCASRLESPIGCGRLQPTSSH